MLLLWGGCFAGYPCLDLHSLLKVVEQEDRKSRGAEVSASVLNPATDLKVKKASLG